MQTQTMRQRLLLLALPPLLLAAFVFVVVGVPFYVVYRLLLRVLLDLLLAIRGRRILLVYSRSPVWEEYVQRHWIPRLRNHAMVLDWSDRASWKRQWSLAAWVFRHWAPSDNFNPMAIVFLPLRPARRIGFYEAFRDWKHGKTASLESAEKDLFALADRLGRPSA